MRWLGSQRLQQRIHLYHLWWGGRCAPGTLYLPGPDGHHHHLPHLFGLRQDDQRQLPQLQGQDTIEVNIPAGVEEGQQLSMRGKGNAGRRGGPAGDLLINIEEKPHEFLQRDGQKLIFDLHLNFADAALGTSVEVPTITGLVKIKIPPGTQSGKIFRPLDAQIADEGRNRPAGTDAGHGELQAQTREGRQRLLRKNERVF